MGLTLIQFPVGEKRVDPLRQRIDELQCEVDRLTAERDEMQGTLNRLALGIVILDRNMCVTFANASAKSILTESDGAAGLQLGRFVARYPRDHRRLKELVKSAVQERGVAGEPEEASLILHGVDGSQLVSAYVMPTSSSFDTWSNDRVALALRRLEAAPDLARCVKQMFSLTDTEAKYALALARGLTLAEEARAQSVRLSTARSHLARIFQKTQTHKQSQLVALLSSGAPAFRSISALGTVS
ncbi:hypothetical protein ARD30_24060 [Bosea thiooxidans]|uniref:DNA-binding transcriptional regulator, CsgD family n=1 Tax=Bosea thiooxidans TaxID=53254 RepID=A0A0Q3SR51_9HYPH|nr:hypothetical protein [Bosea thiooxidans]KQK27938.1 hypothetical protein ARD30_24060 [Bosea thiooxidans]SKC17115.1 DNA-binding transcriptional regulator, CsgD family [Bosea thiooxidans]